MTKGAVALVLHAHLPYVRSAQPGSLEEDWFFQALIECYLPLLETLELASADPHQQPKLTIGLSPTLLSLLSDQDLKQRFPDWLNERLDLLPKADPSLRAGAEHLAATIERHRRAWQSCDGDLIQRFAALQRQGVVDLLTCGATHGYLPLLRHHPEAVRGQLRTAVREHQRLVGERPLGIWLPECAYYEGLDRWMRDAGLRYAVLDGHGLLHGRPAPAMGCTPRSAAAMGWPSSGATVTPRCRCGRPRTATPAIPTTGSSTGSGLGPADRRAQTPGARPAATARPEAASGHRPQRSVGPQTPLRTGGGG